MISLITTTINRSVGDELQVEMAGTIREIAPVFTGVTPMEDGTPIVMRVVVGLVETEEGPKIVFTYIPAEVPLDLTDTYLAEYAEWVFADPVVKLDSGF